MAAKGVQLGFLKYVLGFDSLQFKKGISAADADLAKLQKSFARTGARLAKVGAAMTIGITAPLIAFGKSAFTAASDAAELQSAFDQTFGKMSGRMNAWAEATGNAMGRSTQEIQKAANTFGIFFNTALPAGKAAQMSATFAKLAEDLGSFYNVDTDTAIAKLRSGLAGEAEPLRDFGVFLTEASVKARAMAMGLADANGQISEQAKIAARAAIILDQTTKAQGDVARTSAGTANQVRAAQAAFEELQVTVGTKLLPLITPLISKVADLLNWFSQLPAPVKDLSLAIVGVTAVAGPLVIGLGAIINAVGKVGLVLQFSAGLLGLATAEGTAATGATAAGVAFRAMLGPIALAIAAATGLYLAFKHWDEIKPIVQDMVTAVANHLRGNFHKAIDAAKSDVHGLTGKFREMYDKVVGHSYVPDMVSGIAQEFARLGQIMVDPTISATDKVAAAFDTLRGTIAQLLGGKAGGIFSMITDMVSAFGPLLGGLLGGSGLGKSLFPVVGGVDPLAPLPAIHRAQGGPVVPGKTYMVGERGPEFVSFGSRGHVTPANDQGPGRIVVNQTFAPNFAGNAATKQDLQMMAVMTKTATLQAINENRRRGKRG